MTAREPRVGRCEGCGCRSRVSGDNACWITSKFSGLVRGVFTRWLCALDADPPLLAPAAAAVADAVAAVVAAARAAGRRWPAVAASVSG
jgi:hypothetical protein